MSAKKQPLSQKSPQKSPKKESHGEALFTSEERFRLLVENASDAIAILLRSGELAYMSSSVKSILGYTPQELVGKDGFSFIHPEDIAVARKAFQKILKKNGNSTTFQARIRGKDGQWVWVETIITNFFELPTINGIVANFRSIALMKQLQERQSILDSISVLLMTSFDHEVTLKEVARFLVPIFSDYCRIVTVDEEKHVKAVSAYHVEEDKIDLVQELYGEYAGKDASTHGIDRILATGKPEIMENVPKEAATILKSNSKLHTLVTKLELKSYIGVPLIAR